MPSLGRPVSTRPSRRTVAAQSWPDAHGKRAKVGAGEGKARRVRKIECAAGDIGTAVDDRHCHQAPSVAQGHRRPAGKRPMRDADDLWRVGLPARGAIPIEARPVPRREDDAARRRVGKGRQYSLAGGLVAVGAGVGSAVGSGMGSAVRSARPATTSGRARSCTRRPPRASPCTDTDSNSAATLTGPRSRGCDAPTKGIARANANVRMPAPANAPRTTGRRTLHAEFHDVSLS